MTFDRYNRQSLMYQLQSPISTQSSKAMQTNGSSSNRLHSLHTHSQTKSSSSTTTSVTKMAKNSIGSQFFKSASVIAEPVPSKHNSDNEELNSLLKLLSKKNENVENLTTLTKMSTQPIVPSLTENSSEYGSSTIKTINVCRVSALPHVKQSNNGATQFHSRHSQQESSNLEPLVVDLTLNQGTLTMYPLRFWA